MFGTTGQDRTGWEGANRTGQGEHRTGSRTQGEGRKEEGRKEDGHAVQIPLTIPTPNLRVQVSFCVFVAMLLVYMVNDLGVEAPAHTDLTPTPQMHMDIPNLILETSPNPNPNPNPNLILETSTILIPTGSWSIYNFLPPPPPSPCSS